MFKQSIITFIGGEWRRKTSENLLDFFSTEQLKKVFPNIGPDYLNTIFDDCEDIISCYCLYEKGLYTGTFVSLIEEDASEKILSIHGARASCHKNNLLLFRSYIEIISAILDEGFTLQTSCLKSNIRAIKFNYGVGFKPIADKNKRLLMQVDYHLLLQSTVYRYLYHDRITPSEL